MIFIIVVKANINIIEKHEYYIHLYKITIILIRRRKSRDTFIKTVADDEELKVRNEKCIEREKD